MNREYKNKKAKNTSLTACCKAGALRLQRRRQSLRRTWGTSRNFMDYSPATDMFWKWQWEILRKYIDNKIVNENENSNEDSKN